jgi:hypothetical protein
MVTGRVHHIFQRRISLSLRCPIGEYTHRPPALAEAVPVSLRLAISIRRLLAVAVDGRAGRHA